MFLLFPHVGQELDQRGNRVILSPVHVIIVYPLLMSSLILLFFLLLDSLATVTLIAVSEVPAQLHWVAVVL